MAYPEVFRQSCGLFSKQTGDLTGVYVVDSLNGAAPLTWRSTAMPQAAPAVARAGRNPQAPTADPRVQPPEEFARWQ